MRRAKLGALEVSTMGLGCTNLGRSLDQAQTANLVGAALDLGVNCFDTARLYGNGDSERPLGTALGAHRDQVVIATKFGRISRYFPTTRWRAGCSPARPAPGRHLKEDFGWRSTALPQ